MHKASEKGVCWIKVQLLAGFTFILRKHSRKAVLQFITLTNRFNIIMKLEYTYSHLICTKKTKGGKGAKSGIIGMKIMEVC